MIYSMTAYAEHEIPNSWGSLRFELKSVNHRYLEPSFKLPEWARELEIPFRDIMRNRLWRGKIDCSLLFFVNPKSDEILNIDYSLAKNIMQAAQKIKEFGDRDLEFAALSPMEILKWPNVLQPPNIPYQSIKESVITGFEHVIGLLLENREKEGSMLTTFINERFLQLSALIDSIKKRGPMELKHYREKLHARLSEIAIPADPGRIEQEIVMATTKFDISEEVDRFSTHIQSSMECMKTGDMVGRRLDFLMQELNREANTIASKTGDIEISKMALELKVLIEQVREQVQNLV